MPLDESEVRHAPRNIDEPAHNKSDEEREGTMGSRPVSIAIDFPT